MGAARQGRPLRFESCEDRRLLAVGISYDVATGVLTLTGTSGTDQVSVVGQASYVDIYVGGTVQARETDLNYSNVNSIIFDGQDGTDSLTVQNIQRSGDLAITLTDVERLSVVKSKNVAVTADAALKVGTCSISGTLDITASGELTQIAQMVVAGATTLDVGGSDVTLTNAANNFSTLSITNAQNVSLCDVNAIVLGDSMVSGDLTVQANQNSTSRVAISQATGTSLIVGGATTLTVGPASTITLNNSGNEFNGTVSITAAARATLQNDLATDLGTSSVTKNLTVTSAGVSQSGVLVVGQTATFAAAGADITLDADGNNFRTVALNGENVVLNDVNAVILGTSTVTGNLTVTTDGAITQSGTVKAAAGITTLAAGDTNNITLSNSGNDFLSLAVVSAYNATLRDANALDLAGASLSGALTITCAGALTQSDALTVAGKTAVTAGSANNVTLDLDNDFSELAVTSGKNVVIVDSGELILGTSRVSGTLDVMTGGGLTQSGAVTVSGTATFAVGADDLTLDNASNNFATVVLTVPGSAWLRDTNGMVLGDVQVDGDLALLANLNSTSRTALSQVSGAALTVGGSTTLAAGTASTITLNNSGNEFNGTVSVTSANATLNNNIATDLGLSSVSRNLTVTSADGITQSGALFVGRVATLSAAVDIVLTDADNDFATVSVTDANDVWLNDLNALVFGASTVSGALDVTTEGAITQSRALTVGGAVSLSAGLANDVVLLNSSNDFSSVGVLSAENVALRDMNALELDASAISGTLAVTTAGALTQSGALEVGGKATLTAGSANDITLAETGNNFCEISVVSAKNVALVNSEALVLASSKVYGTLDVEISSSASGGLSQSGAVVVTGAATLDVSGHDVELLNTGNNFSTLAVSGDNVWLRDISGIILGDSTVSGDFSLTAGAAITQSAGTTLTVAGAATLATNTRADITLGEANDLNEVAVTSARDATITAAGALVLGASNVSGDLTVEAYGGITQSGALAVAGALYLDGDTADVDLSTEADNAFTEVTAYGGNIALRSSGSIVLLDLTASGDLSVEAGGSITDAAALSVMGDLTMVAGTGITLDETTATYDGTVSLQGVDIVFYNAVDTLLGDCTATGDMTIKLCTSGCTITNSPDSGSTIGVLTVGGTATLDAGNDGYVDLYQDGCTFGLLVTVGHVTLH